MNKQYDNTNRGIISENVYKKLPTHPDYKGKLNVGGKDFELSGWIQQRKDGSGEFISLSIQEPYNKDRNKSESDSVPF